MIFISTILRNSNNLKYNFVHQFYIKFLICLSFFDALDRVNEPNYIPSEQDILHTRTATMGVIEVSFNMKGKHWRLTI